MKLERDTGQCRRSRIEQSSEIKEESNRVVKLKRKVVEE